MMVCKLPPILPATLLSFSQGLLPLSSAALGYPFNFLQYLRAYRARLLHCIIIIIVIIIFVFSPQTFRVLSFWVFIMGIP